MKILFATKNPAKIKRYEKILKDNGIEVVTLKELGLDLEIDENGKDAMENAFLKAKAYYDATKMVTIAVDDTLFIDGIPVEKQPGTQVRRVNGKTLTDDEMIEYYTGLAREYGGKLTAKWIYGMVIYDGKNKKEYTWDIGHFYFVDKPSEKRNPGYPLSSISVMPGINKYFVDLTEEERMNNKENDLGVYKFLLENIIT